MAPSFKGKIWQIAPAIPEDVNEQLSGYPEILRKFLFNRNIKNLIQAQRYLGETDEFHDPFDLFGMEEAVDRILLALDNHESIVVYGDYDVDGVTSCALLVNLLRKLGGNVRHYIPNRFEEGYGLNIEAIEALSNLNTQLLITVDCGIRSPEEVIYAGRKGIDVLISDHHEPSDTLPDAISVISPKHPRSRYAEKNLAGVGITYKIAQAILQKRPTTGLNAEDYLDLVAVGTVADVAPLTGENRTLVRSGIQKLRRNPIQGLASLAGASGIDIRVVTSRDIGFILGPRINAAGRLETALNAFNLLISDDVNTTGELAQNLDDLNKERQELTKQTFEAVQSLLGEQTDQLVLTAYDHGFNLGVLGLVASRTVEQYYRPTIIGGIEGDCIKASCRSIPGFNITRALDLCSDLLARHGGHSMAAGFTMHIDHWDELVARMNSHANCVLEDWHLKPVIRADMEIALYDLKPEILRHLDLLEPTGMGNPEALFISRNVEIKYIKKVGKDQNHLKLGISDGRIWFDAIAFNMGACDVQKGNRLDILYKYETNSYQGKSSLQLNIQDFKLADTDGGI